MNTERPKQNTSHLSDKNEEISARISAVHRGCYEYTSEYGCGRAHLKKSEYFAGDEPFPTVGDYVVLDHRDEAEARIVKTLSRRSFFSRRDPSGAGTREQAVAANFDYVFIMQSLDGDFNLRRLERYLTEAWQSGATPVIVLTKCDVSEDYSAQLNAAEQLAFGVDVFAVSASTEKGLDQLQRYLEPEKTVVFLGSSGVGKSTLINKLVGEEIMATKTIREKDGRGRHTTTHRQLIELENGACLIDTPGMRELGMWDVSEGLGQGFSDVEAYFRSCRFRDCTHRSEPGCAIKEAIRAGELSPERWESYVRLGAEARYVDDKVGYLREKAEWHKEISLMIRQMEKTDYRHEACTTWFTCVHCGKLVPAEGAGSKHRNHCPFCLTSIHADNRPGDRRSLCKGVMDAIAVWTRDNGERALIHRCRDCGTLSSNRIAADDDQKALRLLAEKTSDSCF